jgi:hypothetical protein
MTLEEEKNILDAFFNVVDCVDMLHLSGGGEPFLHNRLPEMIDIAFEYSSRFDRFMVFTNSTIPISDKLMESFLRNKDKLIIHASNYGVAPERSEEIYKTLRENKINHRVVKYYGEEQDFGGWVDFGLFEQHGRSHETLTGIFANCAVTRDMHGNWRTRDGKVHWCTRSQRGMELDLIPDCTDDYVDIFDNSSREEKREKFRRIMTAPYLCACDYCSGDQGTNQAAKRFSAAKQIRG